MLQNPSSTPARSGGALSKKQRALWRGVARAVVGAVLVLGALVAAPVGQAHASEKDCLDYGYACTPGYSGGNASNTWAWKYYGGGYATTQNGTHNCTLYVAWRLAQNGLRDPGNWGNAADWAGHSGGGNKTPAVGSVAWWGKERASGFGHVAYVDQIKSGQVHIIADNFTTTKGYTNSGWISAASVDAFLHPRDIGGGSAPSAVITDGSYVSTTDNGMVYVIAGGAPLYVHAWSAVGGGHPTTPVSRAQINALPKAPRNGTVIRGWSQGKIYIVAGGAPMYVSNWAAVGGSKPATNVDQTAIDQLPTIPADGTFVRVYTDGRIYKIVNRRAQYIPTPAQVTSTPVNIDVWALNNQLHVS